MSQRETWPGEGEDTPVEEDEVELEAEAEAAVEEAEDPQDTGDELQLRVAHEHAEGDLDVPDDIDLLEGEARDTHRGVGIVVSRFNGEIVNRMLASALAELEKAEVEKDSITIMAVPGAFELP